jgi:hypothetical protein
MLFGQRILRPPMGLSHSASVRIPFRRQCACCRNKLPYMWLVNSFKFPNEWWGSSLWLACWTQLALVPYSDSGKNNRHCEYHQSWRDAKAVWIRNGQMAGGELRILLEQKNHHFWSFSHVIFTGWFAAHYPTQWLNFEDQIDDDEDGEKEKDRKKSEKQ